MKASRLRFALWIGLIGHIFGGGDFYFAKFEFQKVQGNQRLPMVDRVLWIESRLSRHFLSRILKFIP